MFRFDLSSFPSRQKEKINSIRIPSFLRIVHQGSLTFARCQLEIVKNVDKKKKLLYKELYLDGNQITEIHQSAFNNLVSIYTISLFENSITEIMTGTFYGLAELSILNLGENKIDSIQEGSFKLNSKISEDKRRFYW